MEVRRGVSEKGKELVIDEYGFTYRKKKVLIKSGECFWTCTVSSCNAKIFTFHGGYIVSRQNICHSHNIYPEITNRKIVNNTAKRKAEEDRCQQPLTIIRSAIQENVDTLKTMTEKDISLIRRNIYNYKRHKLVEEAGPMEPEIVLNFPKHDIKAEDEFDDYHDMNKAEERKSQQNLENSFAALGGPPPPSYQSRRKDSQNSFSGLGGTSPPNYQARRQDAENSLSGLSPPHYRRRQDSQNSCNGQWDYQNKGYNIGVTNDVIFPDDEMGVDSETSDGNTNETVNVSNLPERYTSNTSLSRDSRLNKSRSRSSSTTSISRDTRHDPNIQEQNRNKAPPQGYISDIPLQRQESYVAYNMDEEIEKFAEYVVVAMKLIKKRETFSSVCKSIRKTINEALDNENTDDNC